MVPQRRRENASHKVTVTCEILRAFFMILSYSSILTPPPLNVKYEKEERKKTEHECVMAFIVNYKIKSTKIS
jgi:hypothetical protein